MNKTTTSPVNPATFDPLGQWSLVVGMAACMCAAAQANAGDSQSIDGPLFREAAREFKTMQSTQYQHKTQVDPTNGDYRYDCVGFVSYALKLAAPKARESAFKTLEVKPGWFPTPGKYAAFFASLEKKSQPGWLAVARASELRPGVIVAWQRESATSNGHAVVVASAPVAGPDGVCIVEVFDSTSSPHSEDSRPRDPRAQALPENGRRSGLGRGVMAFTADPVTGALNGYRWSLKAKTDICPIAAGRPTS
jgi:hypothetical protein